MLDDNDREKKYLELCQQEEALRNIIRDTWKDGFGLDEGEMTMVQATNYLRGYINKIKKLFETECRDDKALFRIIRKVQVYGLEASCHGRTIEDDKALLDAAQREIKRLF